MLSKIRQKNFLIMPGSFTQVGLPDLQMRVLRNFRGRLEQLQKFPNGMKLKLLDKSGTTIGDIFVVTESNVVLGDFLAAPAFARYESLFRSHEQAANDQLLVEVDRLEEEIDSAGFFVIDSSEGTCKKILDLQIMQGRVSFHWA